VNARYDIRIAKPLLSGVKEFTVTKPNVRFGYVSSIGRNSNSIQPSTNSCVRRV